MRDIDSGILKEKALIIVLIIKNSIGQTDNISAKINYSKKSIPKYKVLTEYNDNTIIEIDLNHCYNLIKKKKKKEIWILDKSKHLTKNGKEWIKLQTIQIWCHHFHDEIYTFPNLEDLNFFQPQIKRALQILNVENPFYSFLVNQEKKGMEKEQQQIIELERLKKEYQKLLDENQKLINEKEKYKNILVSYGLYKKEKDIEKDESSDDLDYEDEKEHDNNDGDGNNDGDDNNDRDDGEDESYKPEEEEEDIDMDMD